MPRFEGINGNRHILWATSAHKSLLSCDFTDSNLIDEVKHKKKLLTPMTTSFELIQIRVGGWMSKRAAHRNDLAFVVKGVCEDMVEDECWSPNGAVSIGKMKLRVGVELLIRQGGEIRLGAADDFLL